VIDVATSSHEARAANSFWLWATALLIVVAGGLTTLYLQVLREHDPSIAAIEPAHVDPVTDLPVSTAVPIVDVPPPEPAAEVASTPLPALDESDAELLGWLNELFGESAIAALVVPERLIRNIVVTIDNLPRPLVRPDQRPIRPTPGRFLVTGSEEEPFLAQENYARYEPFMMLVRGTDPATPVSLYRRFRPLFQEAYEDLGYPSRSFDDRLVEVIDHLLGTPEVTGPVALVQPRVMYEYADRDLEEESAGRKWLMRMGPGNMAVMKDRLRAWRAELRKQSP